MRDVHNAEVTSKRIAKKIESFLREEEDASFLGVIAVPHKDGVVTNVHVHFNGSLDRKNAKITITRLIQTSANTLLDALGVKDD